MEAAQAVKDERVKKTWHLYTMKYGSASKNRILSSKVTGLETVSLSEILQTQEDG